MKIWQGYGSEHSANIVLIGRFKEPKDADHTCKIIKEFTKDLIDSVDGDLPPSNRYSTGISTVQKKHNLFGLAPHEIEQLFYDHNIYSKDDEVIVTTQESDVSAFIKLMVEKGAKVEIFSTHSYPEEDY